MRAERNEKRVRDPACVYVIVVVVVVAAVVAAAADVADVVVEFHAFPL